MVSDTGAVRSASTSPWIRALEPSSVATAASSSLNSWTRSDETSSTGERILGYWSEVSASGLRPSDLRKISMAHSSSRNLRQGRTLWGTRNNQTSNVVFHDIEELASPEQSEKTDVMDATPVHRGQGWNTSLPHVTNESSPKCSVHDGVCVNLELPSSSVDV